MPNRPLADEGRADQGSADQGDSLSQKAVTRAVLATRVRTPLIALVVVGVLVALRWEQLSYLVTDGRGVLLQGVVTGVLLGGVYGLVAMGLSLIFGVLGIVNFAHGSIVAVGLYASFVLVDSVGIDPYLALPITVLLLFGFGLLIQGGLLTKTLGQPLENQLLLTVGLSILIPNLLLLIFSPTPRSIRVPYVTQNVNIFGATASLSRIIAFVAAMGIGVLVWLLLTRTSLGTAIRAVAQNRTGAALVGVNVRRIYLIAFGLGTACAGAAAALILPFLAITPLAGEPFTIIAFITVVLGGLGNVVGALIAGLLIGLTYEVGGLLLPGQDKLLLVFFVFVLVLLFRPQGFFGNNQK
jgi:branched-chain amino acid transport system permease protein